MQGPAIMRLPRHLPATTPLTEPPDIILAADERFAQPADRQGWHPWAWGAAILLHILALAILLYTREEPLPSPQEAPVGVSMVFEHGGQPQNEAPPKSVQGLPQQAQTPTAPPPPPPQPQAQVNLGLPQNPLAVLPLPPPQPQAPPHPVQPLRPHMPPHYAMMLNGMSYGSPSPYAPAAPSHRAMNMDLPETDAQAVMGPELAVKGDIGADWMSALNDWVNRHKYYPQQAAEQGQQGTAEIEFTVDRHGNVTGLRLLNSSGYQFLDLAWLGLFQGVQLPPFPPGTSSDHITVDATMQYELVGPGQ
jgi:periplasmic protein TonB